MKKEKTNQEEWNQEEANQNNSVRKRFRFTLKRKRHKGKDKETEQAEEKEELSIDQIRRIRQGMLVLLGLVVVIPILYALPGFFVYNSYEVMEETSVQNASMIDYIPFQKSLLKYSKDGAVYVDEKGEAVWNETFAMKMPAADVCGEYAAIADLNGNDVYIFNTEGKVSSTTMPYKVCDIEVASQGTFAVILEGEKENFINLYDKNGEPISEIQTTINKSGYPMDVDLSENGEKLFSTYLYLDGAQAKNGLAAYNFGVVGQMENADRLVGGYQLEDTIVPKVQFLDNNTVCAFGDNRFMLYSMRQKSSEKAEITFENEVQSVIYNSSYVGVVVPNYKESKKGAENAPYVLELYNTNGRKVMTKDIDFNYEHVRMNEEEIVFTGGTECRIYTVKGKLKFSYTFQKNVIDMVPTGYSRRYIILYDNGSEVIRLKHESEEE
ncbi:MAG: hypothetical protein IJ801_02555 [Lachnospiraceae bacterium]|nr:hypothetical protein [Lachnospiraceae bacterium]